MVYEFRGMTTCRASAQVVGEAFEEIEAKVGHPITPDLVVRESVPEDAPLHDEFYRDSDAAWAHKARVDHARHLIRICVRTESNPNDPENDSVDFRVAVKHPDHGNCYVYASKAVSEPELWAQVVRDAESGLQGWVARNERVMRVPAIRDAFIRLQEQVQQEVEKAVKKASNQPVKASKKARRSAPAVA